MGSSVAPGSDPQPGGEIVRKTESDGDKVLVLHTGDSDIIYFWK